MQPAEANDSTPIEPVRTDAPLVSQLTAERLIASKYTTDSETSSRVATVAGVNVLMVGTGEYTTGFAHDSASNSDKSAGVVALSVFDMKRRGLVDSILMVGTRGSKFPSIRSHFQAKIGDVYKDLPIEFESFPGDEVESDPQAYRAAMERLAPGDVVTVFTPDDTHCSIARYAAERGCHVLIAKPIVKTLKEHLALQAIAAEKNVLIAMEVHKRWDPIYRDARDRIRSLGDFSFFQSYMSQPKSQLDTFRSWAGQSSDISYYLNAHHIDFHSWSVQEFARPVSVYASAATGFAKSRGIETEDTITLTVVWQNVDSGNAGTAIYTSSWIAPKSDVHSQQRFFYMGHDGELQVDQAHRGFSLATEGAGFASVNPLFMKYEPDADGFFAGQDGYGYRSIYDFVEAAVEIRSKAKTPRDYRSKLATIDNTIWVSAILEAGRRSLDGGTVIRFDYKDGKIQGYL